MANEAQRKEPFVFIVDDDGAVRDSLKLLLQGTRTGLDFLASSDSAVMRLPVIFITGRGDDEIKARALDAGVASYLDKPINATQLIAVINRAIGTAV